MGLFSKDEPKSIVLRTGNELRCVVCDFDRFFARTGQLNTAAASFFGLDWTNVTANCWVCGRCGYVHWFLE